MYMNVNEYIKIRSTFKYNISPSAKNYLMTVFNIITRTIRSRLATARRQLET